jgi:hypothetical protein
MEPASRSAKSLRRRVCVSSCAVAVTLLIFSFAPLGQASPRRLVGPYYVDDAEIGKAGSCEIESWSSFAASGDRIAVFSPACVVNPDRPVEVGTNLVDVRSNDQEAGGLVSISANFLALYERAALYVDKDPWLGRPDGGSDCADEVTLSRKGAKSRRRIAALRSKTTKARTHVDRPHPSLAV